MASLNITLTKSPIGYSVTQKRTAAALGLRKMHQTVVRPDNAAIRGMIDTIQHLVTVIPVQDAAAPAKKGA